MAAAYAGWLAATGRGSRAFMSAANAFLRRWPLPQTWAAQPLEERLAADVHTRPFLTFLMLHGHLRPGYDWLARRKIQRLGSYAACSPLAADVAGYLSAAAQVGFSAHMVTRSADRVILRLLIQTGRPLSALDLADLHAFADACRCRGDELGAD